ncbi:hypothetical protein NKR19_g10333 [Coniochaeta hoffmannii]|uniref:Uncharacterized protein n=1 Tax=Coniochaeta hoffmannii TaxID=91930 RepID=A0AA38VI73_9PEZI|nr:hypothetical protein NKR19_g10333 [Coniochaeta hoffmannii]
MDAREDPYDTVPAPETAMALEWITMKQDSRSPTSSTLISWPGQTMRQQPRFGDKMHMFPGHSLPSLASSSGLPANYMQTRGGENNGSAVTQHISSMPGLDPHQVHAEFSYMLDMDCFAGNETLNSVVNRYTAPTAKM